MIKVLTAHLAVLYRLFVHRVMKYGGYIVFSSAKEHGMRLNLYYFKKLAKFNPNYAIENLLLL